ncbi:hydrolase [Pseudomonas amygdali pv. tabaci str. ATCC 11528]|uniref:Alpha/beta hydrolase n=1 Tax=Pseudomonas coleopterorum TaxID=1605838 RepID=A0AAJ6LVV2_9PSED|nr:MULTISPECIES: alpha/beta hydrolase [Pseudomonas]KEZ67867.1 hydrolase [Pseudomonas amygdali pv. tabaci str. ATCC 11528]KKY51314.1 hydrolase [Pseudomonas amygdali pv. tabaci str. ATCC 11528]QED84806.1 alpha/beta hydrolase [Pseudomonas amygdali pv. tabaci str. ATCC 11528]WNC08004.1 alpha/beta hydrolase [Pseudomonas coleopterorum]
MIELIDHTGTPATHHHIQVNGIELHLVTAGQGEPLLLLHGTPKTHIYWQKLFPILTPYFTVIAPDLRGAGLSGHPYAEKGYLSSTVAEDLVQVLDTLEIEQAYVHGEDRGAEYGFVLAASHPDRVKALSFAEMMLSGFGLEERSFLTEKNVKEAGDHSGVWEWHVPFFFTPDVPEMLLAGKAHEFWTYWLNKQSYDPTAYPEELKEEWITLLSTPHGLRGTLDTYKATLENARINKSLHGKLSGKPVMTIGASHFFGDLVRQSISSIGIEPSHNVIFERCGHGLALEQPLKLANELKHFFKAM